MKTRILIENGEIFNGSWERLEKCFKVKTEYQLGLLCGVRNWKFDIVEEMKCQPE